MTAEYSSGYSKNADYEVGQLRFTPDETLERLLHAFYNQSARTAQLGQKGLFLYSDSFDLIYRHGRALLPPESAVRRQDGELLQRASNLSRALEERGQQQRTLAPEVGFKRHRHQPKPDLLIRFRVKIADELTRHALQSTVFLDEDNQVGAHVRVPARKLETGNQLLDARDALEAAVEQEAVDTVDMQYVKNAREH